MYKILRAFLCILPTALVAQPVIDQAMIPAESTVYKAQYGTSTVFDPGPAGESQTWDFSHLESDFDLNIGILMPDEAVGADSFPDADFVWHMVEFESYNFYEASDTGISQMGSAVGNTSGIDFLVINSNTEDAYKFPITYGTKYDYDTQYDNYLWGNWTYTGNRTGMFEADAYGTVTTPFGTYENVMRLKLVTVEFGITSTQYIWTLPDSFIPLLVYEFNDDVYTDPSYYYVDIPAGTSSSRNFLNQETSFKVLQSGPRTLQVEWNNGLPAGGVESIVISDVAGRPIVYSTLVDSGQTIELQLPDIAAGVYYLTVNSGKSYKTLGVYLY